MSINSLLNQEKFNKSSEFTWHTNNLSHEVIQIDDSVSIISLDKTQGLSKVIYKGLINDEVENILLTI